MLLLLLPSLLVSAVVGVPLLTVFVKVVRSVVLLAFVIAVDVVVGGDGCGGGGELGWYVA